MKKFDKGVQWAERALICAAFFVMVAVTFAQVVARFIFNDPISWSEEVARYLFLWITLIGASHAIALGKHFCVDFLISRFPPKLYKATALFTVLCVLVFAAIMVHYGWSVAWRTRFQVSPALELPMCYPYLCIPLSGLFTIVHLVAGFFPGRGGAAPAGLEGGYAE
ncbi:MAG: TRAP transporter small permease [Planctomycetota bacterium]|jgi:TRAP-type C4-dicarboxylate transport system permease small subunit|nr:TRAP transporter small permease [Planctomycetota bacterium]